MANRQGRVPDALVEGTPPSTIFGEEAIERGYADGVGNYFDILRRSYPEC